MRNPQADNTVRVINAAAMRVEATVHGLRPAPRPPPGRAPGGCAALQPGTGHLVVSGPNALLQFFDAARERHASRLQVGRVLGVGCLVGDAVHEVDLVGPSTERVWSKPEVLAWG
jgi:hypothetical protein